MLEPSDPRPRETRGPRRGRRNRRLFRPNAGIGTPASGGGATQVIIKRAATLGLLRVDRRWGEFFMKEACEVHVPKCRFVKRS